MMLHKTVLSGLSLDSVGINRLKASKNINNENINNIVYGVNGDGRQHNVFTELDYVAVNSKDYV
jgi:hypothetical protein